MNGIKVVFVKNGMDSIDGSAEHLVNYALLLSEAGHQPWVAVANSVPHGNQYRQALERHAVPFVDVSRSTAVFKLRLKRLARRLAPPFEQWSATGWDALLREALTVLLRRRRPDLVHVFVDPAAPIGLQAASAAGVPSLCHELITPRPSPTTDHYYDQLRALLPNCAVVAAQSPRLADECRTRIPFEGRVTVIPNVIRAPETSARGYHDGREVVFGFASRFEPRKGPLMLIDAFAHVVRSRSDVRLEMAGDGPLRDRAEKLAAELGVAGRCRFRGAYSGASGREAFFDSVDVVVQPSRVEGLPNTVLEAMAREKAIVCSGVGGITDVLGPESAILVPPDDVGSLASALATVAQDANLRRRIGRAARVAYLRNFSPAAVLPVLLDEYRRMLLAS